MGLAVNPSSDVLWNFLYGTRFQPSGNDVVRDYTPQMTESKETPGDRLKRARLAAGYRTATEFSDTFRINQSTYSNHETGARGIKLDVAEDYEKKLGNVDAAWILTGKGKGLDSSARIIAQSPSHVGISALSPRSVTKPTTRAVRVAARVQAGAWRESPELPGDERYDVFVPIEGGYTDVEIMGAEVIGASMDLLYPSGTVLICVNTIHLGDGWMPEPGDRVVARRVSREGLYETTVKEFAVDANGKAWLVPRSSDPSLMPVPAETPRDSDDEPIKIVGLVIGSYRPERRGRP